MYGVPTSGNTFSGVGAFGVRANQSAINNSNLGPTLLGLTDGTSNTVMLSEGIVPTTAGWGGPIGSAWYGNMGSGLYSNSLAPNSASEDQVIGPCPGPPNNPNQGDGSYKALCRSIGGNDGSGPSAAQAQAAARSKHTGGVNAAMGDGTVRFVRNSIDVGVWQGAGTRQNNEVVNLD